MAFPDARSFTCEVVHASVAGSKLALMTLLRKSPCVRRLYGASVLYTASLAGVDLAIGVSWSSPNATGLNVPGVPWAPVLGGGTTQPCMFPHQVHWCGIALSSVACLLSWGLVHAAQYCSAEAGKDLRWLVGQAKQPCTPVP